MNQAQTQGQPTIGDGRARGIASALTGPGIRRAGVRGAGNDPLLSMFVKPLPFFVLHGYQPSSADSAELGMKWMPVEVMYPASMRGQILAIQISEHAAANNSSLKEAQNNITKLLDPMSNAPRVRINGDEDPARKMTAEEASKQFGNPGYKDFYSPGNYTDYLAVSTWEVSHGTHSYNGQKIGSAKVESVHRGGYDYSKVVTAVIENNQPVTKEAVSLPTQFLSGYGMIAQTRLSAEDLKKNYGDKAVFTSQKTDLCVVSEPHVFAENDDLAALTNYLLDVAGDVNNLPTLIQITFVDAASESPILTLKEGGSADKQEDYLEARFNTSFRETLATLRSSCQDPAQLPELWQAELKAWAAQFFTAAQEHYNLLENRDPNVSPLTCLRLNVVNYANISNPRSEKGHFTKSGTKLDGGVATAPCERLLNAFKYGLRGTEGYVDPFTVVKDAENDETFLETTRMCVPCAAAVRVNEYEIVPEDPAAPKEKGVSRFVLGIGSRIVVDRPAPNIGMVHRDALHIPASKQELRLQWSKYYHESDIYRKAVEAENRRTAQQNAENDIHEAANPQAGVSLAPVVTGTHAAIPATDLQHVAPEDDWAAAPELSRM